MSRVWTRAPCRRAGVERVYLPAGLGAGIAAVAKEQVAVPQDPRCVLGAGDRPPVAQTLEAILDNVGWQVPPGGSQRRSHLCGRQVVDRRLEYVHFGDVVSGLGAFR